MRPYRPEDIERVRDITRPYLETHGEPIAWVSYSIHSSPHTHQNSHRQHDLYKVNDICVTYDKPDLNTDLRIG